MTKPIGMRIIITFIFALSVLQIFAQNPIIYISSQESTHLEGDTHSFTVRLLSSSTTDVIVDINTISFSADESDYFQLSSGVTIAAGQLVSSPVSIPIIDDQSIEDMEYFQVEATVISNNTANTEAINNIFIIDNDKIPTVIINNNPSLVEGQESTYNVRLSNYYNSDVTIEFATTPETADITDYDATNVSKTISAGQLSTIFPISTLEDAITEPDETYIITSTITSGNTTNSSIDITVTIKDNDTNPTVSFISNEATEGSPVFLIARLNRTFNSDVTIDFETSNGTANNSDYENIPQTLTIESGSLLNNILIQTTDDTIDEPEEFFNIIATITSVNTTNISETTTVTIVDNDGLPDFKLQPIPSPNGVSTVSALEGSELRFMATLTHASTQDTDIIITTTNGTTDNTDYISSTINITIPAGETEIITENLSYATVLDQLEEDDETLFINAQVTSADTYNTADTIEATIIDNYDINAQNDRINTIVGEGGTFQILDNDTFEGLSLNISDFNVSLIGNNTLGLMLSPSGILTIPSNIPFGYNVISYQLCEITNPINCNSANIEIVVESPIDATSTATYVDYNGNGYVDIGDVVDYNYTITNNGNTMIDFINSQTYAPNFNVVGGSIINLESGQTDTTTNTTRYVITQDDINFGYLRENEDHVLFLATYYGYLTYDWAIANFNLETSDGLKLNAFVDTNGNGTQETDEINFPLGHFNYEINNDGVVNNLYVSPHYLYESNPTTTYDLSYTIDSDYALNNTTTTNYSNITVPAGSGITTIDFPIIVTPYNDLLIEVYNCVDEPVPGFDYHAMLTITNNSNQPIINANLEFFMDTELSLVEVSEFEEETWLYNPISVQPTVSGFTYELTNLLPYEKRRISVRMMVPSLPIVSLGQQVTNSATIEIPSGDINQINNLANLTETVVGSYDPNDITEKHGEEIVHSTFTSDDYLTYTIRFENTGTANAINVRIEDLLDEQLDESTLKMVDASHSYTLERVGKYLEWNFAGIDLPPSEDDGNSLIGHGFITFKIKPLPGYQIGDVIPNTAEIYFDFNPAIVTNTWTTTFVESLDVDDKELNMLSVYPIPAKDRLQISNNSILTSIEITTIQGKKVFTKVANDSTLVIDVSEFANGIYFLNVKSINEEKTIKFIKL